MSVDEPGRPAVRAARVASTQPGPVRLRPSWAPDPGLVVRQLQGVAVSQLVSWAHDDVESQALEPPLPAM